MITLTQTPLGHAHVLAVKGKIDAKTMGEFESGIRELMEAGRFNIVVDFAEVSFISSAGLGILMSVIEEIRDAGGDMILARVIPDVYRIFDLLEFTTLFAFHDSVEAATQGFTKEG